MTWPMGQARLVSLPSEIAMDLMHARPVGRVQQTGMSRQADAEWPA
jgi:hypothetical protein